MATFVPLINIPIQLQDSTTSVNMNAGTLEFFLAGGSTPTPLFSDNIGTSIGTSITLNSGGYPESGGNVITLFRDDSIALKIVGKDATAATVWTTDNIPVSALSLTGADITYNQGAGTAEDRTLTSRLQDYVSVFDFMTAAEISDVRTNTGVVDVFDAVNNALASLNQGQSIVCPDGTYLIGTQLTEPAVKAWGLVGQSRRGTIFDVSGVGAGNSLIEVTQSEVTLSTFQITGDIANAPTYTVRGIELSGGISQITLENLYINSCAQGLAISNCHDSLSYRGLIFFKNTDDLIFETTASTSQRFDECQFLESERCLHVPVAATNFTFDDCTFAADPYNSGTNPVHIDTTMRASTFSKCRFEPGTANLASTWDGIYLDGIDSTSQLDTVNLVGNYFTGAAKSHIHVVNFARSININDNFFAVDAGTADIEVTGSTVARFTQSGNGWPKARTLQSIAYTFTAENPFLSLDDSSLELHVGATNAIDVIRKVTHLVTDGADALTIADGEEGQEKYIVVKTYVGDGVINTSGSSLSADITTITFGAVGHSAHLLFTNSAWHFMGGTATVA